VVYLNNVTYIGSEMDGSPYGMEEDMMGEDGMDYG